MCISIRIAVLRVFLSGKLNINFENFANSPLNQFVCRSNRHSVCAVPNDMLQFNNNKNIQDFTFINNIILLIFFFWVCLHSNYAFVMSSIKRNLCFSALLLLYIQCTRVYNYLDSTRTLPSTELELSAF